jgi:hypothetical protein
MVARIFIDRFDRPYNLTSLRELASVDQGHEDFGFTDQKGRKVGFFWKIKSVTIELMQEGAEGHSGYTRDIGAPTFYYEVKGSPTRDGVPYGASSRANEAATLDEARKVVARRIAQSRKRDAKKFA